MEILPHEWEYRMEGGQHMVFEYVGLQAPLECKILRLRSVKRVVTPPVQRTLDLPLCDAGVAERELSRTALCPYLVTGDHLVLDAETSCELGERAQPFRPQKRMLATMIPLRLAAAVVIPDLTRLFGDDTICVEIKPKSAAVSRARSCSLPMRPFCLSSPAMIPTLGSSHKPPCAPVSCRARLSTNPAICLGITWRRVDAAPEALRRDKSRWLRVLHDGRFFAAAEFICNRGVSRATRRADVLYGGCKTSTT